MPVETIKATAARASRSLLPLLPGCVHMTFAAPDKMVSNDKMHRKLEKKMVKTLLSTWAVRQVCVVRSKKRDTERKENV